MSKKEFMFDYSLEYVAYMYKKYIDENINNENISAEKALDDDKEMITTKNFSEVF